MSAKPFLLLGTTCLALVLSAGVAGAATTLLDGAEDTVYTSTVGTGESVSFANVPGSEGTNALEITYDARVQILNQIMLPCIAEPRPEVAPTAPKMVKMKIDVDKIREVIGKGGSVIQKIVAESGAKIDIDDDGTIHIASPDAESCAIAKKCIDDIVFVPEIGKLYYGRVVRLMTFGAFVEIAPGKDGLVHISKLADKRIEKVEDACKVGDMMWVKVTEIDEKGRVNLSRKDALKELAAAADKK